MNSQDTALAIIATLSAIHWLAAPADQRKAWTGLRLWLWLTLGWATCALLIPPVDAALHGLLTQQ